MNYRLPASLFSSRACKATALVFVLVGSPFHSFGAKQQYSVGHEFRLTLKGELPPDLVETNYEHVFKDDTALSFKVNPTNQNTKFKPDGTDNFGKDGLTNGGAPMSGIPGVPVIFNSKINIDDLGAQDTNSATLSAPLNSANASASYFVNGFIAAHGETSIAGNVKVDGFAEAVPTGGASDAYAFSYEKITFQGKQHLANGQIQLAGQVHEAHAYPESGGIRARLSDPLWFTTHDLVTGALLTGNLFDFEFQSEGESSLSWDAQSGLLTLISPGVSSLIIDMTSPYTSIHGYLDFEMDSGVVTRSISSGFLADLFPRVGTVGPVTASLGMLNFDYNLGDFSGHDVDISLNNDSAASVYVAVAVPEPGSTAAACGTALVALVGVRAMMRRLRAVNIPEVRKFVAR